MSKDGDRPKRYKRYLYDPTVKKPCTTQWRDKQRLLKATLPVASEPPIEHTHPVFSFSIEEPPRQPKVEPTNDHTDKKDTDNEESNTKDMDNESSEIEDSDSDSACSYSQDSGSDGSDRFNEGSDSEDNGN
jgi:hypothetical protein